MRRALLLAVAACQGGAVTPAQGSGSAVTQAGSAMAGPARLDAPVVVPVVVDAGVPDAVSIAIVPYVVAYDCSHMNVPFGEGGSVSRISYDLGARTVATLNYDFGKEGPTAVKHVPVVKPLGPRKKATLEAAIGKVLSERPAAKPEYPVPEGTSCFLRIAGGGSPVFELEKSNPKLPDAATALIRLLDASTP